MNSSNSEDISADEEEIHEDPKEFDKMFSAAKKPQIQEVKEAPKAQKNQEAEKKRRQFFASTVLDEEQEQQEEKFEDDILNVPAFFRRKK